MMMALFSPDAHDGLVQAVGETMNLTEGFTQFQSPPGWRATQWFSIRSDDGGEPVERLDCLVELSDGLLYLASTECQF